MDVSLRHRRESDADHDGSFEASSMLLCSKAAVVTFQMRRHATLPVLPPYFDANLWTSNSGRKRVIKILYR